MGFLWRFTVLTFAHHFKNKPPCYGAGLCKFNPYLRAKAKGRARLLTNELFGLFIKIKRALMYRQCQDQRRQSARGEQQGRHSGE